MPRAPASQQRGPVVVPPMPAEEPEEGEEIDTGAAGPMGAVDLAQIRQRIMQDPNYIQQLIQEIQTTNPQLYQIIQQNPQALIQLLLGGAGGAGGARGGHGRPRHQGIQVTMEEKEAIDRVSSSIN